MGEAEIDQGLADDGISEEDYAGADNGASARIGTGFADGILARRSRMISTAR